MNTTFQSAERKYRPDIDGLRAIAIISVIAYHAGFPGFSGGFVGVDIFFVISGFLITSLLFNEAMAAGGRVHLGAFYARRVRRLMPAGLLVVAVTLLLGAFVLSPASDEQRNLARMAIAYSYFGSNFYFFRTTGGYFDAPSFSLPLLHTWSLAVEEQYYLIWPLITVLIFRLAGGQRTERFMRTRSIQVLGILLVMSLALSVGTTRAHQNFAFFLLPTRVWEFAIGGMVGLAGTAFYSRLQRWGEWLAIGGLALVVYSIVALDHSKPFPGWVAMLPVFGSALLIVGITADEGSQVRRLLSCKPMVFIGLLSYSWYLWHWPLLSLYRIHNLGAQDVAANALVVVIALLLAWLTYILVEHPIRARRPGPFRGVRSTLFVGLGMMLATLLMGNMLKWWRDYQAGLEQHRPIVMARSDVSPYRKTCTLNAFRPIGELPTEECIHGADKKHPKILLWGDSHADHVMPMLMEAFPDVAVYQLTMMGCPPAIGYESQVPATSTYCAEFNQRVLQKIQDLQKEGLQGVVISARWPTYLWERSISVSEKQLDTVGDPRKMAAARTEVQARFDATLTALERSGVRVLVLTPNPEMVYLPHLCIGLGKGSLCDVPRTVIDTLLGNATAALAEVVSRHSNARLAQVIDFFCDDQTCFAKRDGKILYIDENHLTATAAIGLAEFLRADLDWLLGRQAVAVQSESMLQTRQQ
jgi:peptidoglycan/LPS O-acetylase OafA/YrhL